VDMRNIPAGFSSWPEAFNAVLNSAIDRIQEVLEITPKYEDCPNLFTHADPHFDEAVGSGLVRTVFASTQHNPLGLIVQYDKDFSLEGHPDIRGGIVLGMGSNRNKSAPACRRATFIDEHMFTAGNGESSRRALSATAMVVELMLKPRSNQLGRITPLLNEINEIDSNGLRGGAGLHLSQITKDLVLSEFDYGNGRRQIHPLHMETVVVAAFAAVLTTTAEERWALSNNALMGSWTTFIAQQPPINSSVLAKVQDRLNADARCTSKHLMSMANVAWAVQEVYGVKKGQWLMESFFSALLQAQSAFEDALGAKSILSVKEDGISFGYYVSNSRFPLHRALLYTANQEKRPVVVAVYNPLSEGTVICKNSFVPRDIWEAFVTDIAGYGSEAGVWHIQRDETGRAGFMVNRTSAHRDTPQTNFTAQEFAGFFQQRVIDAREEKEKKLKLSANAKEGSEESSAQLSLVEGKTQVA
jgi:hypothetical protein